MAKQTTSASDIAVNIVSGTFTATGASGDALPGLNAGTGARPPVFKDIFNAALWGTFVATVQLEKTFDGGTTWMAVSKDSSGNPAAYQTAVALTVYEPECNVLYRWNCTSYTSGTINYRISA